MRSGHPWVFAGSIREQSRAGEAGELGIIFDRNNKFLAVGLYDPDSPIALRVLHSGKPVQIDEDWWRERIRAAIQLRQSIFKPGTNAARLINGESDNFPGLVLDRYNQTYVLKLYTRSWFPWLPQISRLIQHELSPTSLILRLSRNIQHAARNSGLRDASLLMGEPVKGSVKFLENGITFEADCLHGQKTGFFLDQRENRAEVGARAQDKSVLNAFSFSGGFSLYAARGGARSVTDVDISAHALKSSQRNWSLNSLQIDSRCQHHLIQANVFDWLREEHSQRYDLIVLDPPSLAKKEADRPGALNAYSQLLSSALQHATPNALLVCCSCSAHVRAEDFFETIRDTLRQRRHNYKELKTSREPIDHHAAFPEAEYLKAIYIQLVR